MAALGKMREALVRQTDVHPSLVSAVKKIFHATVNDSVVHVFMASIEFANVVLDEGAEHTFSLWCCLLAVNCLRWFCSWPCICS